MRFEKYLTFRGHPEGYEKSGGGFRSTVLNGHESEKYVIDYVPQFLEGASHRKIVTTTWKNEILSIIEDNLPGLGLSKDIQLSNEILKTMKSLSGRFALSLLNSPEDNQRQMIAVAIAVNYLKKRAYFKNSIVIPIGSHREILTPLGVAKGNTLIDSLDVSDFLMINPTTKSLKIAFFKVDFLSDLNESFIQKAKDRMSEQNARTENCFAELFFNDKQRLDSSLHQSWLASILRFYLERSKRYALIGDEQYETSISIINRIDKAIPSYYPELHGVILLKEGTTEKVQTYCENKFHIVSIGTATDAFYQGYDDQTNDYVRQEDKLTQDTITDKTKSDQKKPLNKDEFDSLTDVEIFHDTVKVELGVSLDNGLPVIWEGSVKGTPHLLIVGAPGQGKSVTLSHFMQETYRQGVPFVTVDFHGQFSKKDMQFIQAINPTILHAQNGLPFSPFEATSRIDDSTSFWKSNAFEMAEIFAYVCDLGDIQKDFVYQAIKESYEALGFSETNGEYDNRYPNIMDVYNRLKKLELQGKSKNVVARCRPMFEFGLFSDKQGESFNIKDLLSKPLVIDVSSVSLEAVQIATGAFFLRKIWKDMFKWGETEHPRLVLVLDEAHRLSKDPTLPKIMREGRKYGIVVVLASQQIGDFHEDIIRNWGSVIAFRTNFPESRRITQFLKETNKQGKIRNKLENLEVGHAFVQLYGRQTAHLTAMHG